GRAGPDPADPARAAAGGDRDRSRRGAGGPRAPRAGRERPGLRDPRGGGPPGHRGRAHARGRGRARAGRRPRPESHALRATRSLHQGNRPRRPRPDHHRRDASARACLQRRRAGLVRGAGRPPDRPARRRRRDRLGIPAPVAPRGRRAGLPAVRPRPRPLGRAHHRGGLGRPRPPADHPARLRRLVLHRRPGRGGRDSLHRALHGGGGRLRAHPAGAPGPARVRGPGARARLAVPDAQPGPGVAAAAPATGSVDGAAQAGPRLPALRLGGLARVGGEPAGRSGRGGAGAGRPAPDRLRGVAPRGDAGHALDRAAPRGQRGGARLRGGRAGPGPARVAEPGAARRGGPGRRAHAGQSRALHPRAAGRAPRVGHAGIRELHRRVVHHLPREREGGAPLPRRGGGIRPARRGLPEGRLDEQEPRDRRPARVVRTQRGAAVRGIRPCGRSAARAAADPERAHHHRGRRAALSADATTAKGDPPMSEFPSRRRFLTRTGAALLIGGALPALRPRAAWAAVQAKVGEAAPAFTAPATSGTPVSLASYQGKIVVLEWTNHECPYVRKHYETGNMQALQREATGQGVIWLTLISSTKGSQGYATAAQADELTTSRKAVPTAVLLDEPGVVGKMYGATNTPHMYVVDKAGTLVYAGAIDDRP